MKNQQGQEPAHINGCAPRVANDSAAFLAAGLIATAIGLLSVGAAVVEAKSDFPIFWPWAVCIVAVLIVSSILFRRGGRA